MSFRWGQNLKKFYAFFGIGIVLLLACTQGVPVPPAPIPSSTQTPTPSLDLATSPVTPVVPGSQTEPSVTKSLLGMVPLEEAYQIVWVADRARLKALHGLVGVDLNVYLPDLMGSRETTLDFHKLIESTLLVTIPSYRRWGELALSMNEQVGFSQLTFDREAWSDGQRDRTSSTPRPGGFFTGEGNFDSRRVSKRLLSLGYGEVEHGDITYLSNSREGYRFDRSLPRGITYGQMNRVYLGDDRLIAATSTERLTDILDLQLNGAPTLVHSAPHAALGEQLGSATVGAAFIPFGFIQEIQRGERKDVPNNSGYRGFFYDEYKDWGNLHEFSQAVVAFATDGSINQLLVALYYPDPSAADADREEMERRLQEYYLDIPSGSGSLSVICDSVHSDTAALNGGSVLIAKCTSKDPPESYKDYFRLRFVWHSIVKWENLLFLLPNPGEYPAPDCGGKFNPLPNRPDIPASILLKVFCEGSPECVEKFEANLDKDISGELLFEAVCGR